MAISTYAELKTAVADRLHRTDLTSIIPEFVSYAESVIAGDPMPTDPETLPGIRTKSQVKRVTTTLSDQYIDIPSDFLYANKLQINTSPIQVLGFLTPDQLTAKYPSTPAGTPKFYTIHGDEFQFSHNPNTSLTLQISYMSKYAAFSADADYNWLLTNHPMAYLYPALVAGFSYLDDTEAALRYSSMYKTIAKGINGAEKDGFYGAVLASRPTTATP